MFVVLGGIGNIRGSVIAAALLTILPELLREFSDYRMLVYAVDPDRGRCSATNSPNRFARFWIWSIRFAKSGMMQKAKKARGGDQCMTQKRKINTKMAPVPS